MIRILKPGDEAALEAFLLPRVETSMFLIGNMRMAGLANRRAAYTGAYAAAFEEEHIVGVVAHYWNDNLVLQAPVHLTFCADFNRFNKWCEQRRATPGYDNYLSFFTAAIDALLVSQNVALAAEAHGLGICYLGTATYMAEKII